MVYKRSKTIRNGLGDFENVQKWSGRGRKTFRNGGRRSETVREIRKRSEIVRERLENAQKRSRRASERSEMVGCSKTLRNTPGEAGKTLGNGPNTLKGLQNVQKRSKGLQNNAGEAGTRKRSETVWEGSKTFRNGLGGLKTFRNGLGNDQNAETV